MTLRKRMLSKQTLQGSMTVEAAFVMPIVIFVVFALLYLSFYLHDKCRIQGIINKTLHKASITLKHEADIDTGNLSYETIGERGVFYLLMGNNDMEASQIQQYLQQELSEGLFLTRIAEVNSEVGKTKVKLSVETETSVSLYWVKQLFSSLAHGTIKEDSGIHNPAETLRQMEVVLDSGSRMKGVSQLKDKLEGIFGK
ncbi:pilus assembly protein [Lachnospiraceae bacterium MD1]|uniref:Pilus assembly protein n=1 Tax=Variimorphobacter saccharofermentans TaxID=2755051 RepID=A0A839K515_9FIRM|nr:TadE family protein [Variimorphobacter saccharofermentans]MBB2184690.1 pilus assembly protein [Variimorphobacter saccharofermentans]